MLSSELYSKKHSLCINGCVNASMNEARYIRKICISLETSNTRLGRVRKTFGLHSANGSFRKKGGKCKANPQNLKTITKHLLKGKLLFKLLQRI